MKRSGKRGRINRAVNLYPFSARVGHGKGKAHCGELFQGEVYDQKGTRCRALVSLPNPESTSKATFTPLLDSALLTVSPATKRKSLKAVELLRAELGLDHFGGHLSISSNIREGAGEGSSTADVIASLGSFADSVRHRLSEERLARIAVQAEGASDSTMFSVASLFAHRAGRVLEYFSRALPALYVVGIDTDSGRAINTLDFSPAEYTEKDVQVFSTLVGALRRGVRTHDLQLIGRVATACSSINERYLPKPMRLEVAAAAKRLGALGVAAAHSGTVIAVLFDPSDTRLPWRLESLERRLTSLKVGRLFRFQTAGIRAGVVAA